MDILKITGTEAKEFLKKLKLDRIGINEELGDPLAIKDVLSYTLPPLVPIKVDSSSLKLKSSANIEHSTQLFNEEKDKDKDGILGKKDGKDTLISFNANTPMLKHSLAFGVSMGATVPAGNLEFGIESGARLKTIAYLKHTKTEKVREALLDDVTNMPFLYFLPQLKKLKVGEAVAVVSDANLGLRLKFAMSDVVSAGLTGLSQYIGSEEVLTIEADLGAKVGVDFSVKGAYELVFVKQSGKKYKVYVKSAVSKNLKGSIDLGLEVSLTNPKVLSDFLENRLDAILEQITTLDEEELSAFEKKLTDFSQDNLGILDLGEREQKVANFLIDKLKLEDELDKLGGLAKKLAGLRKELKDTFKKAAESKIKAGFNYEYSRISTRNILLKAEITEDILTKTHKDLILFNSLPLVDLALKPANSSKISIEEYLNETLVKTTQEWGISLGVGKYKIGGTDRKELTSESQKTFENGSILEKVAYNGIRKYKESGDLGGFGNDYWVGFNVAMEDYMKSPKAADFDYGFSFFVEHREKKKFSKRRKERLMKLVDMAQLWNIIPETSFTEQVENLWTLLGNRSGVKNISFSYQLNVTSEAIDALKHVLHHMMLQQPDRHIAFLANAFGKAMPFDTVSKFRSDSTLRGRAYGELWNTYFKSESFSPVPKGEDFRFYTDQAERYFRAKDVRLSKFEGGYVNSSGTTGAGDNVWFGGIIRINKPARQIKNFSNGLERLLGAILSNDPKYDKAIKSAFNNMQEGWKHQFCIKALGIYFLDLAHTKGVENLVESKLEIKYTDSDGKEKAYFLQKGEA